MHPDPGFLSRELGGGGWGGMLREKTVQNKGSFGLFDLMDIHNLSLYPGQLHSRFCDGLFVVGGGIHLGSVGHSGTEGHRPCGRSMYTTREKKFRYLTRINGFTFNLIISFPAIIVQVFIRVFVSSCLFFFALIILLG